MLVQMGSAEETLSVLYCMWCWISKGAGGGRREGKDEAVEGKVCVFMETVLHSPIIPSPSVCPKPHKHSICFLSVL